MTDKELKRLSRSELLEMLIIQVEENERLKQRLSKAQEKLQERQIMIEQAGSIAQAALELNGVFEAADKAAKQYLENVRRIAEKESNAFTVGDDPQEEIGGK